MSKLSRENKLLAKVEQMGKKKWKNRSASGVAV